MSHQDLEPTGERLIPERQRGELVLAEHLARYRLAAQLAPGRRVLDVACGEGYGSRMLAAAGAESVTGADVDPATVAHVAERHGVEAVVADIRELPFPDDAFDLVISFETIEHVHESERALAELSRVRAPGGLVVISTPNAKEYLVDNPFHVREFEHEEFVALLEQRFAKVRLLFQHNWLTSAVLEEGELAQADGETPVPVELTKVAAVGPGDELYLVAVCGDEVDVGLQSVGVMAGTDEAHELARRLLEAERTATHWYNAHRDAMGVIENKVAAIDSMRSTWTWRATKPFRLLTRLRRGR